MKKECVFQIRITNTMDKAIKKLAKGKGMTTSDYIRYLIQLNMDKNEVNNRKSSIKQVGV